MTRRLAVCCLTAVACAVALLAQVERPAQRASADLASIPVASAAQAQELTVRWTPYPGAPAVVAPDATPPAPNFAVLERRAVPGPLPRERNPQLSSEQLVAIAVDGDGREIDWQLVKDPRVIRAERPDADGRLTGEVLHRADTELLLTLPADRNVVEVLIYQPAWTGERYLLSYLGAISLVPPTPR